MKNRGTTYACTAGQLATVAGRVTVALPRALELSGLDIKSVLHYTSEGKQLSFALASAMRSLEDGVIYFSVESDGTSGVDWITRLESKGFRVDDYAKQVLRSPDFKPTSGVTYEVAVLRGCLLEDQSRITKKIRPEAARRNWTKPNAELACLTREKFTDKKIEEMGLWYIVVMHKPINDSDGDPRLLDAGRDGDGRWLGACGGGPVSWWHRDFGFAFIVSETKT